MNLFFSSRTRIQPAARGVIAALTIAVGTWSALAAPPVKSQDAPNPARSPSKPLDPKLKKIVTDLAGKIAEVRQKAGNEGATESKVVIHLVPQQMDIMADGRLNISLKMTETETALDNAAGSAEARGSYEIRLSPAGTGKWACTEASLTVDSVVGPNGPVPDFKPNTRTTTKEVQKALVALGLADAAPVSIEQAMTEWVSDHNAFGPNERIVQDVQQMVVPHVVNGENFSILLGAGLVKSGKATRLDMFCGTLTVLEYSPAKAKAFAVGSKNVIDTRGAGDATMREPAGVKLGTPAFDRPFGSNLGAEITGSITVQARRALPRRDYAVRLSYGDGSQNITAYHHFEQPLAENRQVPIAFTFAAAAEPVASYEGPMIAHLDVCELSKDEQGGTKAEVISPVLTFVVNASPKAER